MKKLLFLLPFLAGMIFFLGSCDKTNNPAPDNEFTAVQDDALAKSIFNNTTNIADEAYALSSVNLKFVKPN